MTFGDLVWRNRQASSHVITDLERSERIGSLRGWEGEWENEKDLSCHDESQQPRHAARRERRRDA